jgi:hypothetical protein
MQLTETALARWAKRTVALQVLKLFTAVPVNLFRVPGLFRLGTWALRTHRRNDPWEDVLCS